MNRAAIISVVSVVCTGIMLTASCSQSGPAAPGNGEGSGGSGSTDTSNGQGGSSATTTTSSTNNNQSSGGSSSSSTAGENGGSQNTDTGANGGASEGGQSSADTGAGGDTTATTTAPTAGGKTGAGGNSPKGGAATTTAPAAGGKTGVGGTSAASGGTSAAAGGSIAKGGTSAASGGTSAASGGTSATSSSGGSLLDVVPDLANGFYWEGTCQGSISVTGHNCPMSGTGSSCPSNGIDTQVVKNVKGTSGQLYTVNIEVRGVVGTRCYKSGTRASTAAGSDTGTNNWWYVGGVYDNPTGWWNSYELKVAPSTGDASGDVYYFNGSDVGGGSWCEKEATYLVKYNASFKVKGGGTMTFKIHDQNCKAQQNCGPDINPDSKCAPRTVDLAGMTPQPPASFKQPPTNALSTTYNPQWMWIVATSVTSP